MRAQGQRSLLAVRKSATVASATDAYGPALSVSRLVGRQRGQHIERGVRRTGGVGCGSLGQVSRDEGSDVDVEVLYTTSCPNAEILIQGLRQRDDVKLTLTEVSKDRAVPSQFAGSPTVLVDGTNPFSAGHVDSPACALFPPSVDDLDRYLSELRH